MIFIICTKFILSNFCLKLKLSLISQYFINISLFTFLNPAFEHSFIFFNSSFFLLTNKSIHVKHNLYLLKCGSCYKSIMFCLKNTQMLWSKTWLKNLNTFIHNTKTIPGFVSQLTTNYTKIKMNFTLSLQWWSNWLSQARKSNEQLMKKMMKQSISTQ